MENLIDSVDFSCMDYPDGSNERVLGRRKEAHKLAKRYCEILGANYEDFNQNSIGSPYHAAYVYLCLCEIGEQSVLVGKTKVLEKYGIEV
jgi:hypothetical protein